ncbi:MAG TPA: TrkA C-terminal domain-containing protein [Halococcus sp.]|nr:TrkA C-terminal domain-containing protein [Halococcus sp.]
MPREVGYEPRSVKQLVAEMKDIAELMIDLSYSAVLLGSDEVAEEVLKLEDEMDILQLQTHMSLLMASRSTDDAEALAPVLGIVGATEKVSDATGDIAKIVLEDIGLPDAVRAALPDAIETLVRARVSPDARFAEKTLGDLNLETETGIRAIALRREGEWVLNPTHETTLRAGDVVLFRGPEEAVAGVYQSTTGEAYIPPEPPEPAIDDLERAMDSVVLMKNMSELAVDLAYGAVLFDSQDIAREVLSLEAEVDALQSRFEAWTLRAAGRVDDPVSLRGLVHLARSTEVISDAALEIAEGVLRGLGSHPVIAEAVRESDEVIVRLSVERGSELDGTTLGERMVKTETGMRVIAVRRTGRTAVTDESATDETVTHTDDWVVSPGPETELHAGNVLLAKGPRAAAERLSALVGEA